jgi:hypothetical protein
MSRARDIEELEALWLGGDSDEKVCDQAIEIVERLVYEKRRARVRNEPAREESLKEQERDFDSLIERIDKARHAHALDKFKEYCRNH